MLSSKIARFRLSSESPRNKILTTSFSISAVRQMINILGIYWNSFEQLASHRYTTYFPSSETHQHYVQDVINFVSGNIRTLLEDLSMNVFPRDFEPETPPRPEFDEVIALPPSIMISYFSESRFPTSWERDGFSAILSISFQSPPPARQSSITHAQDDAAVIVAINIRTCSFPPRYVYSMDVSSNLILTLNQWQRYHRNETR